MAAAYQIDGLHCGHCAATVQKALQAKGIAAEVSVEPPRVRVTSSTARDVIAAAVAAAGDYKLGTEIAESPPPSLIAKVRRALTGN